MGILNYSTSVAASKTSGEIQAKLAKHGATAVTALYEGGEPTAIGFSIETDYGVRDFRLPANTAGVYQALHREWRANQVPRRYVSEAQAQRVAWRILKDWVEAQLAIIEAGIVELDEVMLPWMVTGNGRTLAQFYRESEDMRTQLGGVRRPAITSG